MATNMETIWTALAERLAAVEGVKEVTRRPKLQYATEELPVLVLWDSEGDETPTTDSDAPAPFWKLTGEIGILARTVETDSAPTTQLNDLIYAVRTALERQPSDPLGSGAFYGSGHVKHYTNLGGLVRTLAITKVDKGMGAATGQAVASLLIEMEAL